MKMVSSSTNIEFFVWDIVGQRGRSVQQSRYVCIAVICYISLVEKNTKKIVCRI